jgi:hypothetical protein
MGGWVGVGVTERCKMTRVLMSVYMLDYCEGMAELVRQVSEKPVITGVDPRGKREPFPPRKELPALRLDGLLPPARIEVLEPYLFSPQDRADSIIYLVALGEYGVMNVYVIVEDEVGKQIESGFALRDETEPEDWYYFPVTSFPYGASVTVRASAMDPLGGIGTREENVTV